MIIVLSFLNLIFGVGGVSAVSGVDITITGTIGDYSSDVHLRTDSNSDSGLDAYDMIAPSSPSDYASFYSDITSESLAVDSWDGSARTINLVYDVPEGQSGNVVFSWNDIDGSTYTSSLTITGGASNVNMISDSDNSQVYIAGDDSDIYVTIAIGNVAVATTPGGNTGGSTGGGGGVSVPKTVTQPPIDIILNVKSDKLLFDASIVVNDDFKTIQEGDKMKSLINLIPMGKEPYLDVKLTYSIKNLQGKEFSVGESETILVSGQKNFEKEFSTQSLPAGDYILELELEYETEPGKFAVATSSSQFKVEKREEEKLFSFSSYKTIFFVLGGGVLILIVLIIIVIARGNKRIKKKSK